MNQKRSGLVLLCALCFSLGSVGAVGDLQPRDATGGFSANSSNPAYDDCIYAAQLGEIRCSINNCNHFPPPQYQVCIASCHDRYLEERDLCGTLPIVGGPGGGTLIPDLP